MICNIVACKYNKKDRCTFDGVLEEWIECSKVVNIDTLAPHTILIYGCNQMYVDYGTKVCKHCSSSGKYWFL